jgi:class 3 adenylate cyclase
MPQLPSGTVTFVFSDIEGSTNLLKQLGDEGYATALATHRRLVREVFAAHGGQEIDTQGDAFFYSFPRARAAVAAAVDVQRQHARAEWPADAKVRVRLGLHTGEPIVGEEGYTGLDVVRAARIAAGGRGGQILLSETTRAIVSTDLPAGVALRELGQRKLKDIEQPEALYELVYEEAGAAAVAAVSDERGVGPADGVRGLVPWLDKLPGRDSEAGRLIEQRVLAELERAFREKEAARLRRQEAKGQQGRRAEPPATLAVPSATPGPPARGVVAPRSVADEIAKLQSLRDGGALTDEQYERAVERAISGE